MIDRFYRGLVVGKSASGEVEAVEAFQALIKINKDGSRGEPVVIEELNDEFILTKH